MYVTQHDDNVRMSESEYLAFTDAQDLKYEYRDGKVYAMTGASVRHNVITANAITHLANVLIDLDCTVTTSDTRIYIASKRSYRYPDVTVFCGKPLFVHGRTDTISDPVLLVEVLSPGTVVQDYNEKLEEYTQIESLLAYIIIAQDSPKVEIFRRYESDTWLYQVVTGLDAELSFSVQGIELHLYLAQIFRRVQWESVQDVSDERD